MNKLPVSFSIFYSYVMKKEFKLLYIIANRIEKKHGRIQRRGTRSGLNWFLCGINNWTPSVKVGTLENFI